MACIAGKRELGFFKNGQAQLETDQFFSGYNYTDSDSLSGNGCFMVDYNVYGSTLFGDEYIEVDLNSYYIMTVSVKTFQRSYNNRLGSGHLGFACFDKNFSFIDLRHTGDLDKSYLTREANPGDSSIYVDRAWFGGDTQSQMIYEFQRAYARNILFFPPSHPDYSTPFQYSRIWNRTVYSITQTELGDWEFKLSSDLGSGYTYTAATLPDYGYPLPAGTPISRGAAGGTYNYALGAPVYDEEWQTFTTPPFKGASTNSAYPFRWGTKYIKFMNLRNYNYRTEQSGDSAKYYIDNIFLIKVPPPTLEQSLLGYEYRAEYNNSNIRESLAKINRVKK